MRGFSLIEILVSAVILLFIAAAWFGVVNVANMSMGSDFRQVELQQQARRAVDVMIREIRQGSADNIEVASPGTNINFSIPTNITNADATNYSSQILYYRSNEQIMRDYNNAPKVVASNVTNLTFCCTGGSAGSCYDCHNATKVTVHIEMSQSMGYGHVAPFNLTEQVRLRQ
jgi:prepilin-type N-terminal cleavage/methylation domain-containing protein